MEQSIMFPRPEHPRPDFVRDTFLNLNGRWQFAFDDEDRGVADGWYRPGFTLDGEITVPFAYQSRLSGVGPTDEIHPVLWYRRSFRVPEEMAGRRILLRFGAVDFAARVYVNGRLAGTHRGGYTPFALDITALTDTAAENDLCVRAEDAPDCTQPRGKQYWKRGLMGCWYTPVSGIWQTVYLEAAGENAVRYIHITPDIDRGSMTAEIALERMPRGAVEAELTVSFGGETVRRVTAAFESRVLRLPADLTGGNGPEAVRLWGPGHPDLYDCCVRILRDGAEEDRVGTYFGMRKIEVRGGQVYLNNSPLYQRLILDQGYWPDSLLTPPDDESIQQDIRYTLAFGYNGARKHQKVEDPRYYYWADRMGLLVWGELPSPYEYTDDTVRNLTDTLADFIERDFNHPCIITWVPLNESWGVKEILTDRRQQMTSVTLYHLTKALDGTRLCSCNDGWEQTVTDLCALHDYAAEKTVMAEHFASREKVDRQGCDLRACWAEGYGPRGEEAFMVTEYGGIAFSDIGPQGSMGGMETWGYHDKVTDEEAFFERFRGVTDAIRALDYCRGYCYTQLTDVMQEINGLLTPDRKPKVDIKRFAAINTDP